MRRDSDLVAILRDKSEALAGVLDERSRRRWAAVEAASLGYGGESLVSAATGISRPTIRAGKAELASGDECTKLGSARTRHAMALLPDGCVLITLDSAEIYTPIGAAVTR